MCLVLTVLLVCLCSLAFLFCINALKDVLKCHILVIFQRVIFAIFGNIMKVLNESLKLLFLIFNWYCYLIIMQETSILNCKVSKTCLQSSNIKLSAKT